ncbi:ATP-binding protein [Chloroflexota bacterium]
MAAKEINTRNAGTSTIIPGIRLRVHPQRDITRRKLLEEALRESEQKYRALVESTTDLIYMTGKDNELLSLNKSAARFLGGEPAELTGKTFSDIFPAELAAKFSRDSNLVFETGKTLTVDSKLTTAKGEIWISANLSPVRNHKNEIVAVMGVTRDITERKRLEVTIQEKNEQLDIQNKTLRLQREELNKRTDEVTRANQLKSEFLANMSHELRTPLNTIIGFSELVLDEVPGKINPEQKQCLSDILESSHQLLHLINQVLDLTKIESGITELKTEELALAEVIPYLARSMMPILKPRKQSLEVNLAAELPLVQAERVKVEQVIRNLVANASKFTPNEGELKIEAAVKDGWCQVSVIDNGIGIRQEDQERIFEPFCQLDYTPANRKLGTGLGLAVVKKIVEKHGGRVWVESEYGQGSRFTFTLPLATGSAPTQESRQP